MQGNCIPAKRATKEDTGQAAQAQSQIDFLKVNLWSLPSAPHSAQTWSHQPWRLETSQSCLTSLHSHTSSSHSTETQSVSAKKNNYILNSVFHYLWLHFISRGLRPYLDYPGSDWADDINTGLWLADDEFTLESWRDEPRRALMGRRGSFRGVHLNVTRVLCVLWASVSPTFDSRRRYL